MNTILKNINNLYINEIISYELISKSGNTVFPTPHPISKMVTSFESFESLSSIRVVLSS